MHAWLKWCPYQNCPQPNCLLTQAQFILLWYLAVHVSWRHDVLQDKAASNNLESWIQKSLSKPQSMNFGKSYMTPIVWLQMRVCQDSLSTAEEIGTLDQCCLSVHFEIVKVFQYPKFMIDAPYTSSSSINLPILVQLKTNKKKDSRVQGRENSEGLPARDTRFWRRRWGPYNKVQEFFIQESNAKCMILHNIKNW